MSLAVSLFCAAALGASGNPLVYDVPLLDKVVIDGKTNDWQGKGFRIDLLVPPRGAPLPANDHGARCRLGWNRNGLLVLVTVEDDTWIEHQDEGWLWRYDGVELFLASQCGAADYGQWVISPGMASAQPTLRWKFHDHRQAAELKKLPADPTAARSKTETGYVLEVLVPWRSVGLTPALGDTLSFQIMVNDADTIDGETSHAAWYPAGDTSSDSGAMHGVRLASAPASPVQAGGRWICERPAPSEATVYAVSALLNSEASVRMGSRTLAQGPIKAAGTGGKAILTMPVGLPPDTRMVELYANERSIGCLLVPELARKGESVTKAGSTLYPASCIKQARLNIERYAWAQEARDKIVERARPWLEISDDDLWALMFGNTIHRAWMVWSNGHCPACRESVPMYNWKVDALKEPWKVRCPYCNEPFPKNDFHKFYLTGLDRHGIFRPDRADRSLLFNPEHPDPDDPLHRFGVDDGDGFLQDGKRWRFIGAYLIYGHWKQLIIEGIKNLAAAYTITGEKVYARKTGILLDRVADVYPTFDFETQGSVYERGHGAGYVSTWHDACEETREMTLAYDRVFEALADDAELVTFLSGRAAAMALTNPKTRFADIQRNVETGILRDALENQHKIFSNYPRQEIAVAIIKTVLDEPDSGEDVRSMINAMIRKATRVDGVTGEKGLAGYSAFVIRGMATFLGEYERATPGFLADLFKRHPVLHKTYRFHIDTWCMQEYYPLVGDTMYFAARVPLYQGVLFRNGWGKKPAYSAAEMRPSPYTFLWRLYEATGDAALVQAMVHANDGKTDGIPHDLFVDDADLIQKQAGEVIEREGPDIKLGSVNKEQWHIAILRSGKGAGARAAWLHYGVEDNHRHWDGMNLGLFAKGLDLMPDFGYPPVQFGGWNNPKADWYRNTVSHNTVVVDGENHADGGGATTLWCDTNLLSAVRVSCPEMIRGKRFERTVVMVNISDDDAYLLDVFRVAGGKIHEKYMHSHFGTVETTGLTLEPAPDHKPGGEMRNFRKDPSPEPGWSVTWNVKDEYNYLPPKTPVHLRYTDLTEDTEASMCEAWITKGSYESGEEAWIPRVQVRRHNPQGNLESTFVAVIEPYGAMSNIEQIRRLLVTDAAGAELSDLFVAVELRLQDGRRDLIVANCADPDGKPPALKVPDWDFATDADLCVVRKDRNGKTMQTVRENAGRR